MRTWSVIIADNHPISRYGIRASLEVDADFEVVAHVSTGAACIEACHNLHPDIVIMDVLMPGLNGIEATRIIHTDYPNILIIGCSAYVHTEVRHEIMLAGAVGFISKETDYAELPNEIHTIISQVGQPAVRMRSKYKLTKMEFIILVCIVQGKRRLMIAEELGISINTLNMHCRNLYHKLQVKDAKAAIDIALQHKLRP
jgi:DNA-binding NarL/FixJ family response regulator